MEAGVCAGRNEMVSAWTTVHFRRSLEGDQIVAHGDHWEEDRDQHKHRKQLPAAIATGTWLRPKPETRDEQGNSTPDEIEEDLHVWFKPILAGALFWEIAAGG